MVGVSQGHGVRGDKRRDGEGKGGDREQVGVCACVDGVTRNGGGVGKE